MCIADAAAGKGAHGERVAMAPEEALGRIGAPAKRFVSSHVRFVSPRKNVEKL